MEGLMSALSHRSNEYRVTITMRGYGSDEQAACDFLDGFLHTHPEAGPVVSLNSEEDTISVLLGLSAPSQQRAVELAFDIWVAGGKESGIALHEPVRTEVERVVAENSVEAATYVYA